ARISVRNLCSVSKRLVGEPVAYRPHRDDVTRRCRVILQLPSQRRDVRVDRARQYLLVVSPDLAQQLRTSRYRTVAMHESEQQRIRLWRERAGLPGPRHRATRQIDLDRAEANGLSIVTL